jgi:hypothetical protein
MFSKKLIAGILCLALGAVLVPGANASAQTADELQAQIVALQAQLVALTAQLGGTTSGTTASTAPAACAGITFTRNLTIGASGTDVKCLQALLNESADTQVAATGVGSKGFESLTFAGLTKAAVIKFQNKYAADILTPVGLTSGTGFVGASTRVKLNAMLAGGTVVTPPVGELPAGCTSTAGYSSTTGQKCSDTTVTPPVSGDKTEGIMTVSINPSPANGTKVYEGDSKISVLGIKVKATGSAIDVQRLKLRFDETTTNPLKPYDYIDKIYVYDGSDQLTSEDVTSSTVDKEGSNYYITLTGFKFSVAKSETKVLTVKVDAKDSINRDLDLPQTVRVSLPSDGVRGVDTLGLNQYGPADADDVVRTFSVRITQASEAALTVSRDSNTPIDRNVASGDDGEVDEVTMLVFDVKATKDDVKITDINDVEFDAATSTDQLDPQTVYLYDGSDVLASSGVDGGTADFNDLEIDISKGATKTLTIKADYTGVKTSVQTSNVTVYAENIVAENSRGSNIKDEDLAGSAISYDAYLYQFAPAFTLASVSTVKTAATETVDMSMDATFNIQVVATGGDIKIAKTDAFGIVRVTNNDLDTATTDDVIPTYDKPSGVTEDGDFYVLPEETTITFAVKGHLSAANLTANYYDLRIAEIDWTVDNSVAGTGSDVNNTTTYTLDTFKSDKVYLEPII